MSKEKKLYTYCGAVFKYDQLVADSWFGQTQAASEKQARSNLAYQFRKIMGYSPAVPLRLTGRLSARS